MFLVDGSGSIGANVFGNEILRFISEFIDLFDVSSDQTRVGLIQYSDQIRHEFDLGKFLNYRVFKWRNFLILK
jgi:collagen type VI alpha